MGTHTPSGGTLNNWLSYSTAGCSAHYRKGGRSLCQRHTPAVWHHELKTSECDFIMKRDVGMKINMTYIWRFPKGWEGEFEQLEGRVKQTNLLSL